MQTHRDAQIVDWIARLGAAGAEHVMHRFSLSRSVAYARLNSMASDELLEHHAVLYARPGMYTATSAGLRWQGLESLGKFAVRPGGFEHAWQVAQTTVQIENGLAGWPVFSDREIRAVETNSGELFASAKVGAVADRSALHRPDLAVEGPGGKVASIEIELSIKSSSRLAAICRGWACARHIDRVYYLATPGPAKAVERASRSVHATDRVRVLAIEEIPRLIHELTIGNPTEASGYAHRRERHSRQHQTHEQPDESHDPGPRATTKAQRPSPTTRASSPTALRQAQLDLRRRAHRTTTLPARRAPHTIHPSNARRLAHNPINLCHQRRSPVFYQSQAIGESACRAQLRLCPDAGSRTP